jgi:2-polyprenyl-6-methoxyphenol hydroxylase-like FAD-dependent oxidoreductase
MFGQDGSLLLELECPQTMTAWDRMYDLLRQAFPSAHYHLGKEFVAVQQDAHQVSVRFADGTRRSGDIVIGCDGIRSSVRAHFLPNVVPTYAGYVAWRGLVAESAFPRSLHDQVFSHLAFCLPPGEQALGYPVAGPNNDLRPGHRRYNLVWYRPADQHVTLKRLLTDDRGSEHAISIPPPVVSRSAIADMRKAAERVLAPQFRDCWRLADAPFLQAIYDVQSPWLAFGRVTMIGDASYVARPHCGAGVTKAADDALALVDALSMSATVAEALQRYEALRVPFGCHVVGYARQLGSYLQAQLKTPEERAAAERHFSPEAVLRETATTAFMTA